ncbi:hypothetical protein [Aquimarina sp. 2304DJ70-9]|uniref:hypothetical protein n=1 Tax=Aquimarina penaris TaxID=3231044 RepID=UPI003461BCB5
MAKILLTTKNDICDEIKNNVFKYNEIIEDNFLLLSFKKLNVDNENFAAFANGDFIVSAGTLIYDEVIGNKALENIYQDYNGKPDSVRKKIIGNYTLVIKKKNKIHVFVDENSIHDLYYKVDESKYTLGTSLYDVAITELETISVSKNKLAELCAQYSIIGQETFYNEINRLQANQIVVIDCQTNVVEIKEVTNHVEALDLSTIEEYLDYTVNQMDICGKALAKNFRKFGISMTGGLDSRIILSIFLKHNISPKLYYGVGNNSITNTKSGDLVVNQKLSEKYDLTLKVMDWDHPDPIDANWNALLKKYGFLSEVYAGANIFSEFENIDVDFIEYGYFGEPFRNVDWIENKKKGSFSLDHFLDDFYINTSARCLVDDFDAYKDGIRKSFIKVCQQNNLDYNKLTLENFQVLHNEYRKNADKIMLNLSNLFCYSASVLSQKRFTNISESLPKNYKNNASFILRLLDKLHPDILETEFFSHTKSWIFKRENFELKRKDVIKLDKIVGVIRKLNINTTFLEKIYGSLRKNKESEEVKNREALRNFLKEKTPQVNLDEITQIGLLAKYTHNSYMISKTIKK